MFHICDPVFIAHQCFSYGLAVVTWYKAISVSHSAPPMSSLGAHKKLGGDTAVTDDQREIPYHMM